MGSLGQSCGMTPRLRSRRAFLGLAAAAVAVPAAVVAAVKATESNGSDASHSAARAKAARPAARPKVVSENELPGDPNWYPRSLGAPDEMMGYSGQYSVLPGEPVTLYASTTAREFTVKAFRMGWYKGDQARLVWQSKSVPGRRQSAPTVTSEVNTVETSRGPSLTDSDR